MPIPTDIEPSVHSELLGVVSPLANEESSISIFLEQVLQQIGLRHRFFPVLDNASKDATRSIIETKAKSESRIQLVWAPENRCVVDAYFAGYRAALEAGCDWILEMDGGFSHLPSEIPRFLSTIHPEIDYVGGSRFLPHGSHGGPWKRFLISWGGAKLASIVLDCKMTDLTGGFQLYRRPLLEAIVRDGVMSKANFFQTEIRYRAYHWRWKEVPINYGRTTSIVPASNIREALKHLFSLRTVDPATLRPASIQQAV